MEHDEIIRNFTHVIGKLTRINEELDREDLALAVNISATALSEYLGKDSAKGIFTTTEWCPSCGEEKEVTGFLTECNCGQPLVACSMCTKRNEGCEKECFLGSRFKLDLSLLED